MNKPKIALYTALHFFVACVFWFLAFIAVMGLGFKDEWSVFDYILSILSFSGAAILAFPVWVLSFLEPPFKSIYIMLPLQVAVSYFQVYLIFYLNSKLKNKNELSKNT